MTRTQEAELALAEARRADLLDLVRKHGGIRQASRKEGIPLGTLRNRLRRAGVQVDPRVVATDITDDQVAAVERAIAGDAKRLAVFRGRWVRPLVTCEALARHLGVSRTRIFQIQRDVAAVVTRLAGEQETKT